MHILLSRFRVQLNMASFGVIGAWLNKNNMKKDMKRFYKIKYAKQWIQKILYKFLNLKAWLHMQDHKPNCLTLKAAQETSLQHWKNCQKTQNWFQGYRWIQGVILIPLASLGDIEHIPIKINDQSSRNR